MRHCIACGRRLTAEPLFTLENAPAAAQDIPAADEVAADAGITLRLCQCESCGLVQLDCEPVAYYRDVIRAGGYSTTMTELRRRQYAHLIETYGLAGKRFIEVGCGRGEFLKVLTEFSVEVYGMEHRAELVREAQRDGLFVWREFAESQDQVFGSAQTASLMPAPLPFAAETAALSVPDPAGRRAAKFDVFLSFNFLEHQPDPAGMLRAIHHNLAEDGMGLVTVPGLEYIVENGSGYELIRDHIAYYTFGSLRRLLEQNGFAVLEEELINRDTISMIVRKKKLPVAEMPAAKAGCNAPGALTAAQDGGKAETVKNGDTGIGKPAVIPFDAAPLVSGQQSVRRDVDSLLERCRRENRKLALWGAGHQGFTLASTTALGAGAAYILDSAPFKQGRYAPASHLPIVAPEHFFAEPADIILIVAPGYAREIAGTIRQRFGAGVEILALRTSRIESMTGGGTDG